MKLTLHRDFDGAVFLSHVIARCAPVDTCALHGEIPKCDNLGVLQIWGMKTSLFILHRIYRYITGYSIQDTVLNILWMIWRK